MTEFKTNYSDDLKNQLKDFKKEVESKWFSYLNQYKYNFRNLDNFQLFLKEPNLNQYKDIARKGDASEVIDAALPSVQSDEREYYIKLNPPFEGKERGNEQQMYKHQILSNYYRGIKSIVKKKDENDITKELYVEIFQIPYIVQKLKYLVLKQRENLFKQALESHVIIFSGGTGTGKSTQLPQYFLEFGFCDFTYNKKPMMIACTQPRKLAVDTIQKGVSQMLGDWDYQNDRPGINLVGKKYKGVDEKGPNTSIQFISEGSLLTIYNTKVKENPNYAFDEYSVIMIDEAHMRSVDIDRLLSIIKNKVIPIRSKNTKVPFLLVVMSATANLPTFEKYFGGIESIIVEGNQKPVDIRFQKEPVSDYVGKSVELAKEIHTNPDGHISYLCKTISGETGEENGFILAFLNTVTEINEAVASINNNPVVDSKGNYLYAYGLASDTLKSDKKLIENLDDKNELIKVLKLDAENKFKWEFDKINNITRAVIFATNVAEASVTINNLSYCIDSGLEYKMIYNPVNDLTIGAIVPTSKANIIQRKGRVGRQQIGNYYPLFTNEINPVKQPIDQYTQLDCRIQPSINSDFDSIFSKLSELHIKQYNMPDLIDNLIKYLPLYEYNIYTKLDKYGLVKEGTLSLIGKNDDTLDQQIDGIDVKCRLKTSLFIDDIKTPVTNLLGYPKDEKQKKTFIIGLFNNPTVEFLSNKDIFTGEYPWNQNNLEYCKDILDKILELSELDNEITFNDVKDISKDDIKRVKNIGKLKGKMSISQIRRILSKRLPKLNEDTEPEILSSELSNFLLEILNLQKTYKGTDGEDRFNFNTLSKIINNEGLLINPRTENLQNAIKKLIKNGLIEVADPFGNEIRIKNDPYLQKIINLPTTFENKMMLYKTLKNKNLEIVFISSIYLVSIIDYLKTQKGQSMRFINNLLKIGENTELVDDLIKEGSDGEIYVPGNYLFTALLFMFKYLPLVKDKVKLFLENNINKLNKDKKKNYTFEYSEIELKKIINIDNNFYSEVSKVFKGETEEIREDKVRIFFDIMRYAIEIIKSLFDENIASGGVEFIDDLYLKPAKINGNKIADQSYPNSSEDMQEYLQKLQYSVLSGYHSELCIRDIEENYIHSTSNIKFKYKTDERILPKYLVQLESSLVYKGYLITFGVSIEPSIYEIFKKHLDKVTYTIDKPNQVEPKLIIPTTIKGGKLKKSKTTNIQSNSFDPIIYF